MKASQLYKIDFDNMENHNPITKKLIATFASKDNLTPHGNCSEYISKMEKQRMYLGYDGLIYPKFVMEDIEIL